MVMVVVGGWVGRGGVGCRWWWMGRVGVLQFSAKQVNDQTDLQSPSLPRDKSLADKIY